MNQEPTYFYDKEVDVLYISFAPGEKATTAVELNDNILLRFDRAEKRAIGLTLMDFSVLVQLTELGPRNFPLSGLTFIYPRASLDSEPPVDTSNSLYGYFQTKHRHF